MIPSILLRKFGICVSLVAALGLATFASTASAQANEAQTITQVGNGVQIMPTPNPCTRVPGTLTVTFKDIFHLTVNATGGEEATLAITGSALFVPDDPNQPTYTGRETFSVSENFNSKTFTLTFTTHINALGSDGSRFTAHFVGHVTINPDGSATVQFDTVRLSCP